MRKGVFPIIYLQTLNITANSVFCLTKNLMTIGCSISGMTQRHFVLTVIELNTEVKKSVLENIGQHLNYA